LTVMVMVVMVMVMVVMVVVMKKQMRREWVVRCCHRPICPPVCRPFPRHGVCIRRNESSSAATTSGVDSVIERRPLVSGVWMYSAPIYSVHLRIWQWSTRVAPSCPFSTTRVQVPSYIALSKPHR
jgi:hypothetical protein